MDTGLSAINRVAPRIIIGEKFLFLLEDVLRSTFSLHEKIEVVDVAKAFLEPLEQKPYTVILQLYQKVGFRPKA